MCCSGRTAVAADSAMLMHCIDERAIAFVSIIVRYNQESSLPEA